MTNGEIAELFSKKYPSVPISDWRPLTIDLIKYKQGIVIWTDSHDTIAYFPKTEEKCESVNGKS